jgi:hypothetical protein
MKILFKYPTRNRPELFKSTLDLYYGLMSYKHEFEFLITLDSDDPLMQSNNMQKYLYSKPNLSCYVGEPKTKIEACNADIEKAKINWDLVILVSDDMTPVVKGYDDIIAKDMTDTFPKLDGALHYHDGLLGKDKLITLSVMGRDLYNYFGYIYHPAYKSFYCDEEYTNIVYKLNKVKYIDRTVIHHDYKKHGSDHLYDANSKNWAHDKRVFEARKGQNYPIDKDWRML